MSFNPTKIYLTHALRNAVIGEITPNMVAVSATYVGQTIHLRVHFALEITPDDAETFSVIATLVIAGFPDGYLLKEESILLSIDEKPQLLDCCGFLRRRGNTAD